MPNITTNHAITYTNDVEIPETNRFILKRFELGTTLS